MFAMVMMMRLFFNAMRRFQYYEYQKNMRRMSLVGLVTVLSVFLIFAFFYQETVVKLIKESNARFQIKENLVESRKIQYFAQTLSVHYHGQFTFYFFEVIFLLPHVAFLTFRQVSEVNDCFECFNRIPPGKYSIYQYTLEERRHMKEQRQLGEGAIRNFERLYD